MSPDPPISSPPVQTLRVPLGLKYSCPSESTWKLAVSSLLKVLSIGLPVARQHTSSGRFSTMWPELANAFQDFLFTKRYVGFREACCALKRKRESEALQ